MPAAIRLPVHVRVGDFPEAHFGDLTLELTATPDADEMRLNVAEYKTQMAAFLRAAADAVENVREDDEEVDDAATE